MPPSIQGAVVIPALAESQALPATVASLAACGAGALERTAIVVVVNNGPPPAEDKNDTDHSVQLADNHTTLDWLKVYGENHPDLHLSWVDAATPGNELPRGMGVGMARKIGCDSVLQAVYGADDASNVAPPPDTFLLYHLDADTTVARNYVSTVGRSMAADGCHGAAVAFAHPLPTAKDHREAMAAYELFLRYYVQGLRHAGSPYAFHTIGSTMACTAAGYVTVGGMPRKRTAGEDFYFLQNVAKTGRICTVGGTTVYPSARLSQRVPFGTGPRVRDILASPTQDCPVYAPTIFAVLRTLFDAVADSPEATASDILRRLPSPAAEFLRRQGFETVWPKLQTQHPGPALPGAFHRWFDALATVRLVRQLSREEVPDVGVLQGWKALRPDLCDTSTHSRAALLETVRADQRHWHPAGLTY